MPGLGFGLYTLYELDEPEAEQIRRAAAAGYEGVDFVHKFHHHMDQEAVRDALEETGLDAIAVQVGRKDLQRGVDHIIDMYGPLGVSTLVYHSGDENWTERRARDTVELVRRRAVELRDRGWDCLIHPNHWDYVPPVDWPIARHLPWIGVADRLERAGLLSEGDVQAWLALNESRFSKGFNILLDHYRELVGQNTESDVAELSDTVFGRFEAIDRELVGFMLDVGFPGIRGYDPVAVLAYLGDRVEHVHLEDVRIADVDPGRWPPFCQVGEGDVDFEAVIETALKYDVEWLTFSHDPPDATAGIEVMDRGVTLGRELIPEP